MEGVSQLGERGEEGGQERQGVIVYKYVICAVMTMIIVCISCAYRAEHPRPRTRHRRLRIHRPGNGRCWQRRRASYPRAARVPQESMVS